MDKPIGLGVVKLVQYGELYIIELDKIFTYLNKTMVYRTSDSQRIYIRGFLFLNKFAYLIVKSLFRVLRIAHDKTANLNLRTILGSISDHYLLTFMQ